MRTDELTTMSSRIRRVFLIVVDRGVELAMYVDAPASSALDEVLDRVFPAMLDDDPSRRLVASADCVAYDDEMRPLPDGLRIGAIPAPGLVYVVPSSARSLADLELADEGDGDGDGGGDGDGDGDELDLFAFRELVYHGVRLDDTSGPRLTRFLQGPDALFEPDPVPTYDVFVSFSMPDFLVASDLAVRLQHHDVQCFLANTTIGAGSLWNDELRLALRSSRGLVLVASSNVVHSSWVLGEIGAAWILGLPIVVVPVGDDPWLPDDFLEREDVRVVALTDDAALADLVSRWTRR